MNGKAPPLSVVVNEIREIIGERSAMDFSIYYDNPTIYGDLQYVRTKVRSAWEKKKQDNCRRNDYRVDAEEKIIRPDLVKDELQYALDRCQSPTANLIG